MLEFSEPVKLSKAKKALALFGPGILVSVGYMDPGNWATDIEAGAKYRYALLFVVLLSSVAAVFLQCLSMRVGLITGQDLAQLSNARFGRKSNFFLWLMAELAIVMTDIAEVLGTGLAFHLLLGISLEAGILLTVIDTIIVFVLKGRGYRRIEAIVLGLVITITGAYFVQLYLVQPEWPAVFRGFVPHFEELPGIEPWYIAIGILGATVMPHNLFLHSSIAQMQTRLGGFSDQKQAVRWNTIATILSLAIAFLVNAAILILAAAAFYESGHREVAGIEEAYHLLDPIVGGTLSSLLFGIALLAAGHSSTITGTIAGQIVIEGFMKWKMPLWKTRFIARALALVPAYLGVLMLGDHALSKMLVLSQVCLSILLPFTIGPLLIFAADRSLMREFTIIPLSKFLAWALFAVILMANVFLILQVF